MEKLLLQKAIENDFKKQLKQGIDKYKKSIIESEKHPFDIGEYEKILKDNRPLLYAEYYNWKYGKIDTTESN